MKAKSSLFLFVSVLAAWAGVFAAQAGELTSTFSLETTKVLPAGIRNPRYIEVFTGIDGKYSGLGQGEALGQPLFRPVTWNLVLKTQDDDGKRATVAGLVQANGLQGENAGTTTGSVTTFADI